MRIPSSNPDIFKQTIRVGLLILLIILPVISGMIVAFYGISFVGSLFLIYIGLFCGFLILKRPYWGIILIFASLPVQAHYPNILYLSSILTIVGGLTIIGNLIQSKNDNIPMSNRRILTNKRNYPILRKQILFALLFIIWITITNPRAAILSQDRNWLLTYIQLFIFLWLGLKLLSPVRHKLLMKTYIYSAFISAVVVLFEGRIGETFYNTIRSGGLAGNPNEEALYLIIAIIFWFYFYIVENNTKSFAKRIFSLVIISALVAGVFNTVSRTGFISLVVCLILIFFLANRFNKDKSTFVRWVILSIIALSVGLVPSGYWNILSDTQKSFLGNLQGTEQSGTFYLRVTYWKAALKMWTDEPIRGQGIGQFRFLYGDYRDPGTRFRVAPAHNAFLSLLAETGTIGFGLYSLWIFAIFISLWKVIKNRTSYYSEALTWLIVLTVFCIFMLSGNFEYSKVIWIIAGISMTFISTEKNHIQLDVAVR